MDDVKSRAEILEEEGWRQRFVACEPRLSEAVETYQQAGFEVHLEPLPKEPQCDTCAGDDGMSTCRVCYEGVEDRYRIVFTRLKK